MLCCYGEHKSQFLTKYLVTIGPLLENTHLDAGKAGGAKIVSPCDKKGFLLLRNLTMVKRFHKKNNNSTLQHFTISTTTAKHLLRRTIDHSIYYQAACVLCHHEISSWIILFLIGNSCSHIIIIFITSDGPSTTPIRQLYRNYRTRIAK